MSETEVTLTRIAKHSGVLGHYVTDASGQIIRSSTAFSGSKSPDKEARILAPEEETTLTQNVLVLTEKAKLLVRDLDPANDLVFMRIKSKNDEILVAHDKEFNLITLQDTAAGGKKETHNA